MAYVEKPTVYVETTVPSYYVGRPSRDVMVLGHQITTHLWWTTAAPRYDLYISQVVIDEAKRGDPDVAKQRLVAIRNWNLLPIDRAAQEMAEVS